MMKKIADIDLGPKGKGFSGFGDLGLEGRSATDAPGIFNRFISSAIGIMSVIAFIWFIFLLLSGAYSLMTAGGDKQRVESAKKRIESAIIGLIVVVAAVFVVDLIGFLIGIPNILNPAEIIQNINK